MDGPGLAVYLRIEDSHIVPTPFPHFPHSPHPSHISHNNSERKEGNFFIAARAGRDDGEAGGLVSDCPFGRVALVNCRLESMQGDLGHGIVVLDVLDERGERQQLIVVEVIRQFLGVLGDPGD